MALKSALASSAWSRGFFRPPGWDTGWQKALAAVNSRPVNVMGIGDSSMCSIGTGNYYGGFYQLVRANLLNRGYALYGDYYPNISDPNIVGLAGHPWTLTAGSYSTAIGWHKFNASTSNNTLLEAFTVPVSQYGAGTMVAVTLYYYDLGYTWSWSTDGGTTKHPIASVATPGAVSTFRIKAVNIGNFVTGTVISVGWQSASLPGYGGAAIMGAGCVPVGNTAGLGFAQFSASGQTLSEMNPLGQSGNSPQNSAALYGGAMLAGEVQQQATGGVYVTPPGAYAALALPTITPSTGAGAVPSSTTYYYGTTWVGTGGESAIGSIKAVTLGAGQNTVTLTSLPSDPGYGPNSSYLFYATAQRVIYRSAPNPSTQVVNGKTIPVAGTAWYVVGPAGTVNTAQPTSASGSGWQTSTGVDGQYNTNPTVPRLGATTFQDIWSDAAIQANASLLSSYAGPSMVLSGFGWPLGPDLTIIEAMVGDASSLGGPAYETVESMKFSLTQIVEGIRAANVNASIVFMCQAVPGLNDTPASFSKPQAVSWSQFASGIHAIAERYNCAMVEMGPIWNAALNQYIDPATQHPNVAGHTSIVNQLLALPI